MKNTLIAVCAAAFAFAAMGAYAQSNAMSKDETPMAKDAMGHEAMAKDDAMKKGKHEMKKKGAMSHDTMGKPAKEDKMSPAPY